MILELYSALGTTEDRVIYMNVPKHPSGFGEELSIEAQLQGVPGEDAGSCLSLCLAEVPSVNTLS